MKRWFNSSKSYELSSEQQPKSVKERQHKSAVDLKAKDEDQNATGTTEQSGQAPVIPIAINVKETTVESSKRSHRRQKSSGNWQMLLGDTTKPSESQPTSQAFDRQTNGSTGSSNSNKSSSSMQPIRVPVSSTETRPLSFFQHISADESIRHSDSKSKRAEIFPWGAGQTSSPSSDGHSPTIIKDINKDEEKVLSEAITQESTSPDMLNSDQKIKIKEYKMQLSRISQSLEDDMPLAPPVLSDCIIDSSRLLQQVMVDGESKNDKQLEEIKISKHLDSTKDSKSFYISESDSLDIADADDGITDCVSIASCSSDKNLAKEDKASICIATCNVDSNQSLPRFSHTRAIHELENQHVKRNSDPSCVKRKRRHSSSKRKSFPQTVDDSVFNESAENMEMKCEILRISTIDADMTGGEEEAFVLVDPALQTPEGHVRRISVRSFNETTHIEQEFSDLESERYRLAEATGETVVDTTSEESTSTTNSRTDSVAAGDQIQYLKPPDDLVKKSSLRKHMFKSSTELSSLSSTVRSFDESSVGDSDRGSMHSFRSSNKSYSVNDLTLLERPSGFGTLDMNRLVGSFQMLDSIISEHTVPTPDDDSLPSLPASPISATIQILPDGDDEDNTSVKSLTIIRGSYDDLSEGRPSQLHLANASTGITIEVENSVNGYTQSPKSQLSPVSAIISIGKDDKHEVHDPIEDEGEETETNSIQDEDDTIMPLPSDVTLDTMYDDVDGQSERASSAVPITNHSEPFQLPWGARRTHSEGAGKEDGPGAFVLMKLFTDFTWLASRKIEQVLAEPLERPLQKTLQRGEDPQLDQLLSTLNAVAEHCLPSLVKTLFAWYDRQIPHRNQKVKAKGSRDVLSERRDLAVDFLFCLVLIEILKQLNYHPGYDELVDQVVQMSFSHFKLNDTTMASNPNAHNLNTLADLYAEVLGVLAKSRFMVVKKKFLQEIKELRVKEQSPAVANHIISLIMGLKFFRVKMHPIEEFEACVQFLHDLGAIFLDTKEKEIKHAMAGLFVEIMLPMAAIVQTEVNVPVLRNFVERIYPVAIDLANKRRHLLALFPMVTCLLCVSQKTFFKAHWPAFLANCLNNLRSRDIKMSRVALESLYRLVWVYMIRVKCESNAVTTQKLTSIVSALFPKNQKGVMPRDSPLNIYVKILQFIAREKLDFAMREVIFDLLAVGRKSNSITILPERMTIGLRAFLVISDNLQQKDGEPPMPQTVGVMPSGNTLRVKKIYSNKMLTDESAKNIGIHAYYPQIRKAFSNILRLLDGQIGKTAMMTKPENKDRDLDDLITVEKKPKLDLLRYCVAAIPRLIPSSDLSISELVEMLLRYTVHIDEELRVLAYKALENTLNNFWETRDIILSSFVSFIQNDIPDVLPQLVDNALRMLHSLMSHWKCTAQNPNSTAKNLNNAKIIPTKGQGECVFVQRQAIHQVEGLALVMLCSCRPTTRKFAVNLLRESQNLLKEIFPEDSCVITSIDQIIPRILESMLPHLLPFLNQQEKNQVLNGAAGTIDLQWLVDQTSKVWFSGYGDESLSRITNQGSTWIPFDAWVEILSGILRYDFVKANFPIAASNAWPIIYSRLMNLFPLIDPNNAANEQRSSGLLRGTKKLTNERDVYINLWHNYVVFACCVAPSGSAHLTAVPHDLSSSPDSNPSSESRPPSALSLSSETGRDLFKLLIPLMKCDITELRDSCIIAMGRCSPEALHELSEELVPTIKDAIDRKQENVRRRKKKDSLRLNVSKLFHLLASNKVFAHKKANVIDTKRQMLLSVYMEYIDGARLVLESEVERDLPILQEITLNFSSFITNLIKHCPVEYKDKLFSTELRYNLFNLLSKWSRSLGHMNATNAHANWPYRTEVFTELELTAVEAMAAALGCGKIFDPTGISQNDGYIYPWLDRLLSCCDPKVNQIGQETCQNLLRYNADTQYLLDWTIDRCYRGTIQVADGCFTTLVKVFNNREYPCDSVAMLNLALLYCGCPRVYIREMASQLLLTLCKRFLMIEDIILAQTSTMQEGGQTLEDVLITAHCRTQLYISEQLSRLNPELTIQIFSEVCQRIDTAVPTIRHNMLSYLSPWLLNVELVNPQIPTSTFLPPAPKGNDTLPFATKSSSNLQSKSLLPGEGWGSCQASEMVLNNLVYLTVKYGDDHADALEYLWQELSSAFRNNLRYTVKYLLVLCGISPHRLLPYIKRVFVYLARTQSRHVVDELMVELQSVETLPFTVERSQYPPYFKMFPLKSSRSPPSTDTQTDEEDAGSVATTTTAPIPLHDTELTLTAEEGVIFAKKLSEINPKHDMKRSASTNSAYTTYLTQDSGESSVKAKNTPYPLPMPAFGGYHAPLHIYMQVDGPLLINNIQRCFLSLCAISDLFVDNQSIDWTMHMPTLLHVSLLGCDHGKCLVYEHCKKSLLSLLLCVLDKDDHMLSHILEAIITLHSSIYGSVSKPVPSSSSILSNIVNGSGGVGGSSSLKVAPSTLSMTSICTLTPEGGEVPVFPVPSNSGRTQLVKGAVEHIINLLKNREGRPLWNSETVTPKQKDLKSLRTMSDLLTHLVAVFKHCLPQSLIDLRWCQTSLQFAMSCPSRHYAGRSLQIFRLVGIPMNTQMLSEITSRLVEVVCESGDDIQGFVTEILQTIEKSVTTLDIGVIGTDPGKDLFMSTPNLLKSSERSPSTGLMDIKRSTTGNVSAAPNRSHKRSTSVSISNVTKKAGNVSAQSPGKIRPFSEFNPKQEVGIDSMDHESISDDIRMNMEEKLSTLVQMFWLGASLLESDYEHEFLLAVNLLKQVLNYLKPDRIECKDKMEKTLQRLNWPKFPGLHSLVVKGLTSPQASCDTWTLLSQLTLCVRAPVISQSETLGFPVNVMCLLPYMVQHYEDPTSTCLEAADNIAQMALEISNKLDNLATVMRLYSRGTFGKDAHQWTKCVVKYLTDIYETEHLHTITLLLEVLEQGAVATQAAVLLILHCVLHYVDISSLPSPTMSSDLISTVSKFVEGSHWCEAQKILKLAVKSSSSLIPVSNSYRHTPSMPAIQGLSSLHSHTSFAEAEILVKKDLPGRTLDFTFDVSSTPVIGERYLLSVDERNALSKPLPAENAKRSGNALSSPSVSSADSAGNWRRPHHSQSRVRDRLFALLATLGQRVGVIKSPSVIFSQVSEPVDRQMSVCSSSEETGSVTEQGDRTQEDSSVSDQFGDQYFKEFDFLDNEAEHIDDETEDKFNWGVKRQHSFNELDVTEVTKHEVLERVSQRKREAAQEAESSAKSTDDEGPDEFEQSGSPIDEVSSVVVASGRDDNMTIAKDSDHTNSVCSDTEVGHQSPVTTVTGVQTFLSISGDEVEDSWRSHLDHMMSDTADGTTFSNMYSLFSRLFKETTRKLSLLTKEVCFYLSKTPSLRNISSQFLKTLEIILTRTICPFTYIDPETASSVRMSDNHKFALLEVHEAYMTYLDRRELAQECLENIKSSIKMQSLGTHVSDFCGDEKRVELCNGLYRLQFQLMVLHSNYMKLINSLVNICEHEEVINMSEEVSAIASSFQQATNTIEMNSSSPPEIDTNNLSQAKAEQRIVEMITSNKSYIDCIQYIRALRQLWPGDLFGVTSTDDIPACLSIYCRHITEDKKNGLVVVTRSPCDLSVLNRQLLDLKLQLNAVLAQLSQTCKVEVIHKLDTSVTGADKSLPTAETRKATSPSLTVESNKVKVRPLSPKFKPIELQPPNSPRSKEGSGSAQVSPIAASKGGLSSPSTSASGDDANKSLIESDTIMASSAL